jgi:hypothetical protein
LNENARKGDSYSKKRVFNTWIKRNRGSKKSADFC